MLNYIYQLISPKNIMIKYGDIDMKGEVIVRPEYLALCHADQRYYQGKRDAKILREKLPMALVHEACGVVLSDPTGTYQVGDTVVMIPNVSASFQNDIIYENYKSGSKFMSSGIDGFMRESVSLPINQVIKYTGIEKKIAAITEFVSVGIHAVHRFDINAHECRERIGVWGDGSLAYVVSCILKKKYPKSQVIVIGKNMGKLQHFSFVDETYLIDELERDFKVDHAFECVGGEGSFYAIDSIIETINPQGMVVLMGVTENRVLVNTRNVLEKGLTLVGCSRSGRRDFEKAIEFMQEEQIQRRLKTIVYEAESVRKIADIHRVFYEDLSSEFKTVFKWEL